MDDINECSKGSVRLKVGNWDIIETWLVPKQDGQQGGTFASVRCRCGYIATRRLANLTAYEKKNPETGCKKCSHEFKKAVPNIVGKRFGRLVVREDILIDKPNYKSPYLICDCDCGVKDHKVPRQSVIWGQVRQCIKCSNSFRKGHSDRRPGTVNKNKVSQVGNKFKNLLIIRELDSYDNNRRFEVQCDCGRKKEMMLRIIKYGTGQCINCASKERSRTVREAKELIKR